jgi:uncharacterized protein (TIGR02246 family)
VSDELESLYARLIDGWNAKDGRAMAATFAPDGEMLGYDGSHVMGRDAIAKELSGIFADHDTASFVTKVKLVRSLGPDVGLLRAIAGMLPPGSSKINPEVNTHHSLLATRFDGEWQVVLFQNTPAQFHGRPELSERMTAELQALV